MSLLDTNLEYALHAKKTFYVFIFLFLMSIFV